MRTGSYVNGTWYHPDSTDLLRNVNPADTSDVIAEFPLATAADVARAVEAAQAAWPGWRKTPAPERGRVLWRAAESARRRVDEIARTLTREEGKVLKEARGEVLKGIAVLEVLRRRGLPHARQDAAGRVARHLHLHAAPAARRRRPHLTMELPWAIPVWKSAPAIVAGNCVVFKPSELVPATAALLAEVYEEAGLPPGVFHMVVGSGPEVGEAMVHAPALRAISFTGSNRVGQELYVKAARRGARVTCEMGGKNAVIVMPDADLDKAAMAIHGGAFGSTGQRCTATSRVIAHPDVKAALVDRLAASARQIKVGPGLDEAMEMGPSISDSQWATVMRYIEAGRAPGPGWCPAARVRITWPRATSSSRRSSTTSIRR